MEELQRVNENLVEEKTDAVNFLDEFKEEVRDREEKNPTRKILYGLLVGFRMQMFLHYRTYRKTET